MKYNEKLDIHELLKDLENYRPKRRGWHWRERVENLEMGGHTYYECSKPLKNSIGIPSAISYFDNLDPQPMETITTEIASGRFEDDIRRMRMAAWHGADHLMVIRTAGQSHYDGLIEGTPKESAVYLFQENRFARREKHLTLLKRKSDAPSIITPMSPE